MRFPRETSCELQNALCAALGYLDAYRRGEITADNLDEVLTKVEQQVKKAYENELKVFFMMGWNKSPIAQ